MMNRKIKFRESFRPFAPAVRCERAREYFDPAEGGAAPYMLLVTSVRPEKRVEGAEAAARQADLAQRDAVRSEVPAITHVDCSARLQVVDEGRHPMFHRLIAAFERKTGCPLLVNTSFNVRGEPIVCSPEDAYRCFMATNMDVLVLGAHVLYKGEQPEAAEHEIDEHRAKFALD